MNKRILVCEDSATTCEFYRKILGKLGEVVTTCKGSDALSEYFDAAAASQPFDIVILDIKLPGRTNGLEVLEKIREKEKFLKLPNGPSKILIITSCSEPWHQNFAWTIGCNAYLNKPVPRDRLITIIESLDEVIPIAYE